MASINPDIFRGYDIRGVVEKDLNPEVFYILGKAYATFLFRRQIRECIVGMDIRETSPQYKDAFIKGLVECGFSVIDFGLSLTQIMYFAQYHYLSRGGAIITASHNPKEYNGLKLAVGFSDTMVSKEVQEVRKIAESQDFKSWGGHGSVREDNVFPAYKADLFKRVPLHNSGLKVVIDASNATTGAFLPEILRDAGCRVVEENTNLDSSFPLGTPDPTEKVILDRLAKEVLDSGADIGFTFDSDGDRVGIVDNEGHLLWNDKLVALFALDILDFLPESPIVFNTLSSKTVSDAIAAKGGKGIMWKVGHSFIKEKVKEERAPFGGELSGHFFFMDNFYGHDDGAFTTLRLLQYLKRTGQTLKEATDKLPQYVSSPEIKLGLADDIKFQLVNAKIAQDIRALMPTGTYTDIDGIRADTKDEMVTVRGSQNGPYITIRIEGKTQEQYDALKARVAEILKKYPEIDWTQGVNTEAFN